MDIGTAVIYHFSWINIKSFPDNQLTGLPKKILQDEKSNTKSRTKKLTY